MLERLFVKYVCENAKDKDKPCDFSFVSLVNFPYSNILPKKHIEIAKGVLTEPEEVVLKRLEKLHPDSFERYKSDLPKIREAKKIVERIGFENLFVSASLDRGYYCPKCHNFELQFDLVMSWKENREDKLYRFSHQCSKCGERLAKLTGTSKQNTKLVCPKCSGKVDVADNSFINVIAK
ncbi:MAG: hypothetical protein IJ638_02825 [Alphaproteobacteria bacterium]|nr:hypothetical protein [Alphaproteobacteria bacterium]